MFDTLHEAKDQKKNAIVVLYDLSSPFDTVCHETLLTKLQMYGLTEHSVKWIRSYLENRIQMVTVGGEVSSTQYITLGTPQGSRLSPLLFPILLADMDLWTDQSLMSNFADDTQQGHCSEFELTGSKDWWLEKVG